MKSQKRKVSGIDAGFTFVETLADSLAYSCNSSFANIGMGLSFGEFKNTVIDNSYSMTGEITLRGRILPVGGLKEKLIAAKINNIETVFIPKDNDYDLDNIPEEVKKDLEKSL